MNATCLLHRIASHRIVSEVSKLALQILIITHSHAHTKLFYALALTTRPSQPSPVIIFQRPRNLPQRLHPLDHFIHARIDARRVSSQRRSLCLIARVQAFESAFEFAAFRD